MAARFNANQLVVKMLGDVKFRRAVMKNPERALNAIDAKPTKKQIKALNDVDWDELEKVMDAFSTGMHPDSIT